MIDLLLLTVISGLFSLSGGLLLLWKATLAKRAIIPLLSFAAGAFLAAGFFDILPEALESSPEVHPILLATLLGFTFFFVLERLLMTYFYTHSSEEGKHSDHTETLSFLLILGDSFHNFLDGIVIALAYLASPALGLITTVAVTLHELPQEIGDFSILLNQGWSKSKIIAINVFQSLVAIPGVLIGYFGGQLLESQLPYFLGGTAGVFFYLGASNLIPELHHKAGHKHFFRVIMPFTLSMVILYFLVAASH